MRARRSCLSVPGSSPKMLAKAPDLPADEVLFDLEDSVAPLAKQDARASVIQALKEGDWSGKTVGVRVNGTQTRWCYRDVIEVVEPAGHLVDSIILPKVENASDLAFLDGLLRMIEEATGVGRRIAIEAQIETATGLCNIGEIAGASDRTEALIFGPVDMSASLGLPGMRTSGHPQDGWHWVLETILVAARSAGLQAIDGPYLAIQDMNGLRETAARAQALGYDGKWAIHPGQLEVINEVFTPAQEDFDLAMAMLDAYEHATEVKMRGAVTFGGQMIDEASRKVAAGVIARGRAAQLTPGGSGSILE